jgi:hypothetical protein
VNFVKVRMAMDSFLWIRRKDIISAFWDSSRATLDVINCHGDLDHVDTEMTLPELEAVLKTNPTAEVLYGN